MGDLKATFNIIKMAIIHAVITVLIKSLIVILIISTITFILSAVWGFLFGWTASAGEKSDDDVSTTTVATGNISLTTPSVSENDFKEALTNFYNKLINNNSSLAEAFKSNFLDRADDIWKWSKQYGVNPELVITMAYKESGFKSADGQNQNYWGLDTPNGSSLGYISTFEEGVKKLAETFEKYQEGGSLSGLIEQKYNERQAANCNQNGYGKPGTLIGMLSVYSDLCGSNTIHREGSSGDGGNYMLREFVYTDPGEFEEKCGNIHTIGVDEYTIQEKADYTAALYNQQIKFWNEIFGEYAGEINSDSTSSSSFLETAKKVWCEVCERITTYNQDVANQIPVPDDCNYIDCSAYVSWVLYEYGYTEFEGSQRTSYDFMNNNWNAMYGWTEISVAAGENPIDKIEPGDIFVRRDETGGHVQIIAEVNNGDVTAYDCGNASNWLGHNGSPHTANWFLADSRPGKIIRVTEP